MIQYYILVLIDLGQFITEYLKVGKIIFNMQPGQDINGMLPLGGINEKKGWLDFLHLKKYGFHSN